ncbi:uncharacterized protein CANTADRAFT_94081 [Suhomyces tanzawaensis NRRL Y-17324]|uniref:HRDC domain-containing protein n=1 Tax=Suhomyces tanzawaensis NRRL Y-17324 TaxID=984487 RepID=A0A1E4SN60_9ASCO|nr:uncharacterized protein CANTADRAFT_94081 [Suhomyces tanzawaensis NRRL Y-17324]ODV80935.1 hypothetical protein CANTADRAFT_94081 [Suhomyces tanzawaensis NRRL Y-17324]
MSASSPQKDVFDSVLPKVLQTIRAASALGAQDVNFYKSIDSALSSELDDSARNVMELTKKVIQVSGDDNSDNILRFGKDNISGEANWKPLGDVLDAVFEKIDIAFSNAQKKSKPAADKQQFTYLEDGNDTTASATTKKIEKPQLEFKISVDNSESTPFKPKITSKPHSLTPYEESVKIRNPEPIYEDSVEIIDPPYYPHPYEYEIDHQPYPESILEKADPIPSKDWNTTSAIWVNTPKALEEMIDQLSSLTEIAVDLEHHDFRTYYGIVCLMQISNRENDWIVDTLALRDDLEPLNQIFANPSIVKVFHGAFMDIIWLQRDLGLYVVSLFDTYHASRALGFPKFSLAYLLETYASFKTSKKYQLADWRIRPLIPAMMAYARSDTHFLLNIFDQLRNKLVDAGDEKLQKVLYDSRQVAKRRFEYTKFRPLSSAPASSKVSCPVMSNNPKEPYASLIYQYNIPHHKKPIVEMLYNWRDLKAKKEDESVRFIMPNQLLVNLANLSQPIDAQKVLGASNFVTEHVRLNARDLAELLQASIKDSEDKDWDLVDQWREVTNEPENFDNIDNIKALATLDKFDKLKEANANLLNATVTSSLLKHSNIFNSILIEKSIVTQEFDPEKDTVIKHDFTKEYEQRLATAKEGLEEVEKLQALVPEHEAVEEVDEEVTTVPQEQVKEETPEESAPVKSDPNEIITIKNKKNFNKKTFQKGTPETDEAPLDYANADKIMLEKQRKGRDQKKKKRAFDPYGKESEGPQPSKKARRVNMGKTSTFTKKR